MPSGRINKVKQVPVPVTEGFMKLIRELNASCVCAAFNERVEEEGSGLGPCHWEQEVNVQARRMRTVVRETGLDSKCMRKSIWSLTSRLWDR